MFLAGKVSLLLLSLAAGYATLALSNKQERPLDTLGRLVGGLILLVSFIGLLCVAVCSLRCRTSACSGSGMKRMCPFSKAPADAPAAPAADAPSAPQ